jgi:hypothetical protein
MRRSVKPASNEHAEQLASARKKFTPNRVGKQSKTANKENVDQNKDKDDSSSDSD